MVYKIPAADLLEKERRNFLLSSKLREILTNDTNHYGDHHYNISPLRDFGVPSYGLRISSSNDSYLGTLWLSHDLFHVESNEFVLHVYNQSSLKEFIPIINRIKKEFCKYDLKDIRIVVGRDKKRVEELVV